ncbi:hypothetical protein FRC02_001749 [Tulasnella sp. 418]|nr:hypothetical protein FRC02_001749 [Tulasnella sp. 418]
MNRTTRERPPYRGRDTSLIISIDLGTTFSGSAWSLLEPQQIPEVVDVSGYPGQEFQAASTKVPTVMLYDRNGTVQAAGSEIFDPEINLRARREGWLRVEWFKLLLRPRGANDALENAPISPLPLGKPIVDVVGDFLAYMSRSAISHFRDQMAFSEDIWRRVKDNIVYVLSHPNGWETYQHSQMRRAAIRGGLVPDTDQGRSRIQFVSEGEASLHWCMVNNLARTALKVGSEITVIDAGGGTIDVSSYKVSGTGPLRLEERQVPDCRLVGSVFVTKAFENFTRRKLRNSSYGDEETISRLVKDFDKTTKCVFRNRTRRSTVTFGSYRENDPENDIEAGELIVQGAEMASFFENSCVQAAEAVRRHASSSSKTMVFMVGGFAASPWLFSEIKRRVDGVNMEILKAETMTAKAAANGAVNYYLDHRVSARVAKWTYGVYQSPAFSEWNAEHLRRRGDMYVDPASGWKFVKGGFHSHVKRGTVVQETQTTRLQYSQYFTTRQENTSVLVNLVCYKGGLTDIDWVDEDPLNFETLCFFTASIPASVLTQGTKADRSGFCWECKYDAVVSFGTTEFKCRVEWKDAQGRTQSGVATPVWNEG